jgi:hypothetical protein
LQEYISDWKVRGIDYYVLSEKDGFTVCSDNAMNREDAIVEVDRLSQEWFVNRGIANPRMVDMWSYPSKPKLIDIP